MNAGCIRPQAALWTCLLAFMHVFIGILIRSCVYLPCLEESENSVKSEHTKTKTMDVCAEDVQTTQIDCDAAPQEDGTSSQDVCLIGEDGGVGALQEPPPKRRRLQVGNPWRLRLDYLVAYGPQGQGTFCMVCSQVLHETKVSSFRQHIQEHHPETTALSRQEREAMAAAWTKDSFSEDACMHDGERPSACSSSLPLQLAHVSVFSQTSLQVRLSVMQQQRVKLHRGMSKLAPKEGRRRARVEGGANGRTPVLLAMAITPGRTKGGTTRCAGGWST